jgi:hypothetical protein
MALTSRTPPLLAASLLRSDGRVVRERAAGPSPFPLKPWHEAHLDSYSTFPKSNLCPLPSAVRCWASLENGKAIAATTARAGKAIHLLIMTTSPILIYFLCSNH